MPAPSIFISPPSGPGGKDVVIQGFNFQPNRDIFIQVAGVIVSTARTQDEGRFTTQIFVPIAGKGAHSVRVIDASGNVASSSFFMDFGFDTIQEATDQINTLVERFDALDLGGAPPPVQGGVPKEVLEELQRLRTEVEELKAEASSDPAVPEEAVEPAPARDPLGCSAPLPAAGYPGEPGVGTLFLPAWALGLGLVAMVYRRNKE